MTWSCHYATGCFVAFLGDISKLKSDWNMKKWFCCPALELFHCLPLWKTVRLHGKKLQNATNTYSWDKLTPVKLHCMTATKVMNNKIAISLSDKEYPFIYQRKYQFITSLWSIQAAHAIFCTHHDKFLGNWYDKKI